MSGPWTGNITPGLGYPPFFLLYLMILYFLKKKSIEKTILLLGTGYTCLPFSLISFELKIAEHFNALIIWGPYFNQTSQKQ